MIWTLPQHLRVNQNFKDEDDDDDDEVPNNCLKQKSKVLKKFVKFNLLALMFCYLKIKIQINKRI